MSRRQAIRKTIEHLQMLKECGQREIEVDLEAVKTLKDPRPRRASARAAKAAVVETPKPLPVPPEFADRVPALAAIAARIAACAQCKLHATRTNTVPGQGYVAPEIMFIGEGPGADEDAQGLAFVGRAGQLLTKIIEAMGLSREDVFIGNIVKCRPPDNRVPEPQEMETCIPYLKEQIAILKPKVIVCLGATAVKGLFGVEPIGITKIRGQWRTYEGIDVMPTYHPAYLLRNPPMKKFVWDDMKDVLRHLGRPVPSAK